jgi:hypothetical protein
MTAKPRPFRVVGSTRLGTHSQYLSSCTTLAAAIKSAKSCSDEWTHLWIEYADGGFIVETIR